MLINKKNREDKLMNVTHIGEMANHIDGEVMKVDYFMIKIWTPVISQQKNAPSINFS